MFNECLDIRWKTAYFCILNFSFKKDFVWEEISNIRHSVSSPDRIFNSLLGVSSGDETLHLMFDILHELLTKELFVSEKEVLSDLAKLATNKEIRPNGISNKLLKEFAP